METVKYRLSYGVPNRIVIIKETDKTVTFIDDRGHKQTEHKNSGWANWFDTMEEAKEWKIKHLQATIDGHEASIKRAITEIDNINETWK